MPTASTTISTNWFAKSGCNLVQRAVRATLMSNGFSIVSLLTLKLYKNLSAYFLASSYPSVMILGWTCSCTSLCACFIIYPMSRTLEVVPSPTISSWAVADRAIIPAVGCCICISWSNTLPSLVNLICPAPPTSILRVPFGPKFDFITYWSPIAALMFMAKACIFFKTSALGFKNWTFDIELINLYLPIIDLKIFKF